MSMDFMYLIPEYGIFDTPALAEEFRQAMFLESPTAKLDDTLMIPKNPKYEVKWVSEVVFDLYKQKIVHWERRNARKDLVDVPILIQLGERLPRYFNYITSSISEQLCEREMWRAFNWMEFALDGEFVTRV